VRFIHGRIYTIEDGIVPDGYLETEGSIIRALGPMEEILPEPNDIDLAGACILPGLIDAHTCLGLKEDSMRKEGNDWNEHGWTVGPELRAIDGFNPDDRAVRYALSGGVTAVAVSPGNENLVGGQIAAVKLCPNRPAEMLLDPFCALKLSIGEQAKGKNVPPCTRMAIGAMLRECFRDGGRTIAGATALKTVLRGEKPVFIHADRCDDIAFAVELCREFHLRCVIVHGSDSLFVGDILRNANVPVIIGSMLLTPANFETRHMDLCIPAGLDKMGVSFAISTDHHMSPIQALSISAALAVREGLSEEKALEAITIKPAQLLGIAHRVGSLRVGKDADLVIWNGSPFSYQSRVLSVIISGQITAKFDQLF